ncbi:MAG: SpoIIE family protein phosphatase [Ignavibacteriales bacterium]|nr:SpoIIE family protein phosphatase [Ignavibacteriales bacterium]
MDGDKFLGVVVVDYALDELDEYLRSSFDTGTQRFIILSKEGKYISHPDKSRIVELSLIDDTSSIVDNEDKKTLLSSISSGDNGYVRVKKKDSNENILAFYSSIPVSGWNIVAYELEDSLTAPINDIFRKAFYALLFFFIISFFAVSFITGKLLSPIKQIRVFTRSITSGDYPEKLKSTTKDEFEKLVTDLNIMNEMLQKRENDLLELNRDLEQRVELRTAELKETAELLKVSNTEITRKNKYIGDSINYAKQIQDAILPSNQFFRTLFPDYFLIFLPKDIVSGDFYWVTETESCKIFSVIDCTGHGVPGAFMSMIGNTLLNEIINVGKITDPGEILNMLNKRVIEELNKDVNSESFDGMDMAIGVYNKISGKLSIAGAYRPVYYIAGGELNEIKGTKKSIGDQKKTTNFLTTEIHLTQETEIYLFSDGITDQNNTNNEKYGGKRLKEILLKNHNKSHVEQQELLLEDILTHKGEEDQRDDIAFLGLKLKPLS